MITDPVKCFVILWAKCRYCSHLINVYLYDLRSNLVESILVKIEIVERKKPLSWCLEQKCPKSCCSRLGHLWPDNQYWSTNIPCWRSLLEISLLNLSMVNEMRCLLFDYLLSNLLWLVINAAKRWRSTVHWTK